MTVDDVIALLERVLRAELDDDELDRAWAGESPDPYSSGTSSICAPSPAEFRRPRRRCGRKRRFGATDAGALTSSA